MIILSDAKPEDMGRLENTQINIRGQFYLITVIKTRGIVSFDNSDMIAFLKPLDQFIVIKGMMKTH